MLTPKMVCMEFQHRDPLESLSLAKAYSQLSITWGAMVKKSVKSEPALNMSVKEVDNHISMETHSDPLASIVLLTTLLLLLTHPLSDGLAMELLFMEDTCLAQHQVPVSLLIAVADTLTTLTSTITTHK